MNHSIFFNAHHSPIGAFASFTLGYKGPKSGLGLELGGPANEDVFIGVEDRDTAGQYQALPFYGPPPLATNDYDVEGLGDTQFAHAVRPFPDSVITREFTAATDTWRAEDLSVTIYSPPRAIPDPASEEFASTAKHILNPSVMVEITLDNRQGTRPRKAFFGYAGSDRSVGMHLINEDGLTGIGQGTSVAIATDSPDAYAGLAWQPEGILNIRHRENLDIMLGNLGLIVVEVPAGEIRTTRYAVSFFREGTATSGIRTRYLYRRWFERIEGVLSDALANFDATLAESKAFDQKLAGKLSPERSFMLAHAIRSYFGSTELLETEDGEPLWVVNEGEYRMMNTFDLTVDHVFFELSLNPWVVRNVLELFVSRYMYSDEARKPGEPENLPGGISFTHDMGVSNSFSPPGRSSYEQAGLTGCFSYMSAEELMNWVLTAGLYVLDTKDSKWAAAQKGIILDCLRSLQNRDAADDAERNGLVGLDGARCRGGAEITTYDSLDVSLGQARNNLYLGVKAWASYLVLARLLSDLGEETAAGEAHVQADRASVSILAARDETGRLPAVIGEGVDSRIIPAIEALIYPHVANIATDKYDELKKALDTHFRAVMESGECRFPNGAWKLSSTSKNSWLSKIYLCQAVAEQVLGHEPDEVADAGHVGWLMDERNAYFAWSDQILDGLAVGSKYYPRGVTSILWLATGNDPLGELRALFV